MDNQLKHRLTGATILVLLIVLLVPEMLSGPQPVSALVTLPANTPGDDMPMRSFDIDVGERVVAPGPTQSAPLPRSATLPAASAGAIFVQLGSFAAQSTATRLAAQLEARGFAATVTPITSAGRSLHRVRVGPAADRAAGEALAARLRAAGHAGSVVSGP